MKTPNFTLEISMKAESKAAMKERLQKILNEFDQPYGKPLQGTTSEFRCETFVKTSIWDGRDY